MADKTRTSDATMGKINATPRNRSAQDVRKGFVVPKKGSSGGMMAAATANHRPNIQENMGAQMHPTATLYAPNAAESGLTQRNTRLLPPATVRSFEGARGDAYGR